MSGDNASEQPRKRARDEDDERSKTIYLQCRHISKPWDLLNGYFFEHRDAIGMTEYYEEKDVNGVKHSELKSDAPVEVAYAFWSRKPFYLVEFRGDRRAVLASNLLALGDKTKFKEASVSVSLAQGTSVTAVKEKMNLLGGVPKHNDNTADEASRVSKPAAPVKVADERPVVKPALPQRPSATTFVPRALWKR